MASHKDFEDYIDNVYNFKKVFKDKCSVFNIENQPHVLPLVERIIVIGDIHGDLKMMLKVLKVAKVIDENDNWIGGETVVVQVGDQIDRCRYNGVPCNLEGATYKDEGNDWKILKYFTKLHQQAQKQGGAVYSLLGNHELMNVNGDFRYVSYKGLREFDDFTFEEASSSDEIYNKAIISKIKKTKVEFEDGEDARRWAFAPGNPISEFLACTRQMALIIGPYLFVHAGVLPTIAKKYSVKSLNQLMSLYLFDLIKNKAEYHDIFSSSDVSPLWNRVFGNMGKTLNTSEESDNSACDSLLNPLKKIYKVDKIFVGHTPMMEHGISNVCDGKIWLTDYGLSKAFDIFEKKSETDSERYDRRSAREAQVLEILNVKQVDKVTKKETYKETINVLK